MTTPNKKLLSPVYFGVDGWCRGLYDDGEPLPHCTIEGLRHIARRCGQQIGPMSDHVLEIVDLPAPLFEQWRGLRRLGDTVYLSNTPCPSRAVALAQFSSDDTIAGTLHIWTDDDGDHAVIDRSTK